MVSFGIRTIVSILDYVEEQFGTNVAQNTHLSIMNKVEQLRLFPQIGHLDRGFSNALEGVQIRHLILAPNVIYYLIDDDRIVIFAIVHSKQSPETIRKIVNRFLEHYR